MNLKSSKNILLLFLLIGNILLAQSPMTYGQNSKAGKYAKVNGINLYYEVYGSGEPILLLHGNGGSIENFKHQISFFSKKYKVIAVDSRAQGKSKDNSAQLNYQMMADDFSKLLDVLNIKSAHIIGWSDGGISGLLMAMNYPEKVKKLIISGANLNPEEKNFNPKTYQVIYSDLAQLEKEKRNEETINKIKVLGILTKEPNITNEQLQKIKAPVLVIAGDNDAITLEHTLDIYHHIPNANLWILPSSGHATLQHHSEKFNKEAHQFLSSPFSQSKWDDWD